MFNLLALFIITYIVVDTFYRVVNMQLYRTSDPKVLALKSAERPGDQALTPPEYATIVERNIFGATEKAEPPPPGEAKVELIENLEETSLQLSLLGTVAGDPASARAIIMDQRGKSQDIYRVGDSVQEAEIRQILRGKVVLRHGGNDEVLILEEGANKAEPTAAIDRNARRMSRGRGTRGLPQAEDSAVEPMQADNAVNGEPEEEIIPIAQDELQGSINDLSQLMTQVRIRPYFRAGKPEGLIVSQIQSDSIFEKLGLMNGDIIASVNGKEMSSPEEAFHLYNSLNSGSQVSIEITRRGQKKVFTYDIQ